MVDEAYVQFLEVIEKGRQEADAEEAPRTLHRHPSAARPAGRPQGPRSRTPATAPTAACYTAAKAKELDLIDAVGTLDDAIKDAAKRQANLTDVSLHRVQQAVLPRQPPEQPLQPGPARAARRRPVASGLVAADVVSGPGI